MITHQKSKFVTAWFSWMAKRMLQKEFRKCSLTASSPAFEFDPGVPVLAVVNHTSWWDAMLAMYLSRYVIRKDYFGVFAEEELERYAIFRKVGCFSVKRGSTRDTIQFLKYTREVLTENPHLLWIFPQGDLMANDDLPMEFKPGFAHVAMQFKKVQLLKMVVNYDFWMDQKPEIVIDCLPVEMLKPEKKPGFAEELTRRVSCEMNERALELRRIVKAREISALKTTFATEQGTNPFYDWYRGLKAKLKGEEFRKSHGRN